MFANLSNRTSFRGLALIASLAAGALCSSSAQAAMERVTGPIINGDVVGTNANQFYAELIGTDLFYSWGATNQAGGLLFNGGNNAGVNRFTVPFAGGAVLGSGGAMMFDSIRDKGGKITRKLGPGVIKPSTLQIAGMPARDVVTKIDPLNKTVRKAANATDRTTTSGMLEIELTNETDDLIFVTSLSVRVNNIDNPLDFSTPFVPDGTIASLDQPFAAQSLSPGASLLFTYSGPYDEHMPVSVVANSTWSGDSFTGTLGTYVDGAVPEPGSVALLGVAGLGLLRRRRATAGVESH
jgi:hypothetical protein